ncbi:MAG: outer membrane lipoprotein-sorting protein [Candidatus Aminicenantes bacterium]|nr:outer membrane lipoprotein-sorting protein [Candidatus Aminicenantes bacterium]MDH5466680.1 outer membrane lipoprotein-sorting protein [Candidatus Aminicenantes bacterium]MDH5706177.1 outer membrane lipoprotein-sorting protein [Candidatus Aminicenantes bacterium]
MNKFFLLCIVTFILTPHHSAGQELSAEAILARIDDNMVYETAYSEIDMIITIGKRVIEKKLVSYSGGVENSFIEFLSPARDRGTKMLKTGKVLKVYFPSAERVMRLSGHMLKQSMMGSDFSYEDMMETAEELKKEYQVKLLGEEIFNDIACYVLELESRDESKTYFFRKIWVDKEKFIGHKVEFSAKSGKLLKVMTVGDTQSFKNRYYPTRVTMVDKLREDSKTEMMIKNIQFDIAIPEGTFTERNLMRR